MASLLDVTTFLRVVEEGSFAAAAASLGMSRSYASKLVSGLERRLDVRLLNRTTRSVSLTDAGTRFYIECGPLVEALADVEARMLDEKTEPRGRLRISAPVAFGTRYLSPVFAAFCQQYQGVDLEVDYSERLVDLVAEGFDLAIRGGNLADSSFVARRLCPFNIVVAASPDYLARKGTPTKPSDLSEHDCLVYTANRSPERWWFHGADGRHAVGVSGPMRSNSVDALVAAACAGLGIAYQPEWATGDALAAGKLVPVLEAWSGADGAFWAIYPHRDLVPTRLRLFVDHLSKSLSPPPWTPIG